MSPSRSAFPCMTTSLSARKGSPVSRATAYLGGRGRQTSAVGFDHPARDPGPVFAEDRPSHEQSGVAARRARLANGARRSADQVLGREQLRRRDQLIVARRQQKNRGAHSRQVDWLAQGDKLTGRNLVSFVQLLDHLEVIGSGQIDGPRVPIPEYRFQRGEGGRADRFRRL